MLCRFQQLLQDQPKEIKGKITREHIVLDITQEFQHFWSPQLNFRVEKDEESDSNSVVAGLIGPKPSVWTLFMFIYFLILLLGFFITSYGVSKWLLGELTAWLWGLPCALVLMLTAYGVGKYGEQLAKDQIEILKQFVRNGVHFK